MIRDYDIRTGEDGRKNAIEHVIFTDPSLLYGKEIGMACYNYKQKSNMARNEFKMALINQHGVQLYPTEQDDTSWMFCVNQSREESEKRKYIFQMGDDKRGENLMSNGFKEHVKITALRLDDVMWDFNHDEAVMMRQD